MTGSRARPTARVVLVGGEQVKGARERRATGAGPCPARCPQKREPGLHREDRRQGLTTRRKGLP